METDTFSNQLGSFTDDGNQYLTFRIAEEEYGVEILKVQEIRGHSAIRPLPTTPAYVKGVMNLRGTIIPVLDMRIRFGLPAVPYNQFSVIIVVTIGSKVIGMVVDAVSDVLHLPEEAIQEAPDFGTPVDLRFVRGMAKAEDKLVALLDIEKVPSNEELTALDRAAEMATDVE